MAKGERRFNSAGQDVVHFDRSPLPEDDYDLKLLADDLGVRSSKDKGPNAIPYINCRFEALNTAAKEGQKNRLVFKRFFLSLKPSPQGSVAPLRGGGLTELYRSKGMELEVPVLSKTIVSGEGEDATQEEVEYLDPEAILEQLQEWTDSVFRAHVSVDKPRDRVVNGKTIAADPKAPGQNDIDKWLMPAVAQAATGTSGKPAGTVTSLKSKKK